MVFVYAKAPLLRTLCLFPNCCVCWYYCQEYYYDSNPPDSDFSQRWDQHGKQESKGKGAEFYEEYVNDGKFFYYGICPGKKTHFFPPLLVYDETDTF